MLRKILLFSLSVAACLTSFAQQSTIELTFTAADEQVNLRLDSIKVFNRTNGGDTVLRWPDTVLTIQYQLGLDELKTDANRLRLFQNYPNPFRQKTTFSLYLASKAGIAIKVSDLTGRVVNSLNPALKHGYHDFEFSAGEGSVFFITAICGNSSESIKLIRKGETSGIPVSIAYLGARDRGKHLKSALFNGNFSFQPGDELLYIGYSGGTGSGLVEATYESGENTFQFATNIPCAGTPTVEYEGKTYNTVQVMSQCWLKENLDIGQMIPVDQAMEDNGIIEKYCYDNDEMSCEEYGGLYTWHETIQYVYENGTRGICPPGWHVPTDEEWKVLEAAADSEYGPGNPIWDELGDRGADAGKRIKSTVGWLNNGNGTDDFGFTALPAGKRDFSGFFVGINTFASFWTSTARGSNFTWLRELKAATDAATRYDYNKEMGFNVRCIKDN